MAASPVNASIRLNRIKASGMLLFAGLLGLTAFAGCITMPEDTASPHARLDVVEGAYWAGEPVWFDLSGSYDPNGRITAYLLDFGDGNRTELGEEVERVDHVYAEGGEYIVTLTVTDDGAGQDAALNDTTTHVVNVHVNATVTTGLLVASPADDQGANESRSIEVRANATGIHATLVLTSALLVGNSEAHVRVLAPDGTVLAEENVTVRPENQTTTTLHATPSGEGEYRLDIRARSGAFRVDGNVSVTYGQTETVEPEPHEGEDGNETARARRYA